MRNNQTLEWAIAFAKKKAAATVKTRYRIYQRPDGTWVVTETLFDGLPYLEADMEGNVTIHPPVASP